MTQAPAVRQLAEGVGDSSDKVRMISTALTSL